MSTLRDLMDCIPPGSYVHGILQTKILECVVIPFSRGSSWPRDQIWITCIQADSLPFELPGKPLTASADIYREKALDVDSFEWPLG